MKNKKHLIGILAIALVFTMTVVGCEVVKDDGDDSISGNIPGGDKITLKGKRQM